MLDTVYRARLAQQPLPSSATIVGRLSAIIEALHRKMLPFQRVCLRVRRYFYVEICRIVLLLLFRTDPNRTS